MQVETRDTFLLQNELSTVPGNPNSSHPHAALFETYNTTDEFSAGGQARCYYGAAADHSRGIFHRLTTTFHQDQTQRKRQIVSLLAPFHPFSQFPSENVMVVIVGGRSQQSLCFLSLHKSPDKASPVIPSSRLPSNQPVNYCADESGPISTSGERQSEHQESSGWRGRRKNGGLRSVPDFCSPCAITEVQKWLGG